MKGYFTKIGKYGSGPKASVVVTEADVKDKKYFEIAEGYAKYFISAGVFVAGEKEPPKVSDFKEPVKKATKKKETEKAE